MLANLGGENPRVVPDGKGPDECTRTEAGRANGSEDADLRDENFGSLTALAGFNTL
jgi:hypothetical protein